MASWRSARDPPFARAWWQTNSFVAKSVMGVAPVVRLLDRVMIHRALRDLCGFPPYRTLPSEATFSRIFHEFTEGGLGQRVDEDPIKNLLGDQLHLFVWRGNLLGSLRTQSLHRILW